MTNKEDIIKKLTPGERMIASARQALAFAKGEADIRKYRVHTPDEINVRRIRKNRGNTERFF